jgi:integrase
MSAFILQVLPAHTPDSAGLLIDLLTNSVVSAHTARAYGKALDDFMSMLDLRSRPMARATLMEFRARMIARGLSASTINVRLSAIRKLVREARDNDLLDPVDAARIITVPNVPEHGQRLGHWLSADQTRKLLAVPDRGTMIGLRDFAIFSVLVYCALRRDEAARLDTCHIQMREGRWVIADLVGKHGRIRTVPLPAPAKEAIDDWTAAAGIAAGPIFRAVHKSGKVGSHRLSGWAVWSVVVAAARAIGIDDFGAHDMRRTSAKLCREQGGELEQIQLLLGHASLETTDRYLGSRQELRNAVNDGILG